MSHPLNDSIQSPDAATPLHSTLANDPDMVELLQFFVDEIDHRIETIRAASRSDDIRRLRTVAHQLKGAAAGYGFEPISKTAAELERLIDETEAIEVTQAIQQQADELIDLCRRVSL